MIRFDLHVIDVVVAKGATEVYLLYLILYQLCTGPQPIVDNSLSLQQLLTCPTIFPTELSALVSLNFRSSQIRRSYVKSILPHVG